MGARFAQAVMQHGYEMVTLPGISEAMRSRALWPLVVGDDPQALGPARFARIELHERVYGWGATQDTSPRLP